jgi:predicted ATPase with chaperone activity
MRRLNLREHSREVRMHCKLDEAENALINAATRLLGLDARSSHRILSERRSLQVLGNIADLAGSKGIEAAHLAKG